MIKMKQTVIEWLARRLPTCKEVTRMASDTMERKFALRQRIEMKLHFMVCAWCLRYFKQLQLMRELAHQHETQTANEPPVPTSSLSPQARERMKRSLQR